MQFNRLRHVSAKKICKLFLEYHKYQRAEGQSTFQHGRVIYNGYTEKFFGPKMWTTTASLGPVVDKLTLCSMNFSVG